MLKEGTTQQSYLGKTTVITDIGSQTEKTFVHEFPKQNVLFSLSNWSAKFLEKTKLTKNQKKMDRISISLLQISPYVSGSSLLNYSAIMDNRILRKFYQKQKNKLLLEYYL